MSQSNYWMHRRISRRMALRGIGSAAAGLAGAALIGCGGEEGTERGTTPAGTAAGGGQQTPAPSGQELQPKIGGHLRVAGTLEPTTLDPVRAVSGADDFYLKPIYDSLVSRDKNDEVDLVHSLTEDLEVADETTIVFHLRQGVTFHDGEPFTSADVVWNLDYLTDPEVGSVSRQSYLIVDEVETPDAHTAIYHLSQPSADLIGNLAGRGGQMLSPKAKERLGDEFGSRPVGSGPFVFGELVSGSHVNVKRNENYWRTDANGNATPYLGEITFRVIPDSTVRLAALTTGDVEFSGVDPKDVAQVQANPNLVVSIREGTYTASCIVQNPDIAPTDNPDVRRAVLWALDPSAVNEAVYFGLWQVADGGISPPATWAYQPVPSRPTYDPQKAKQYLENAGYPDGITIDAITYSNPLIVQQTEIYLEQLKAVGINWNLKTSDVGAATQEFFEGRQMPIYSTNWGGGGSAPDGLVRGVYGDGAFYNPSTQPNPESRTQELLDEALRMYDQEQRKELYLEINKIVLDQGYWVPMVYGGTIRVVSKKLQNQEEMIWGTNGVRFDDVWLE